MHVMHRRPGPPPLTTGTRAHSLKTGGAYMTHCAEHVCMLLASAFSSPARKLFCEAIIFSHFSALPRSRSLYIIIVNSSSVESAVFLFSFLFTVTMHACVSVI
jgi:hypothetical protein